MNRDERIRLLEAIRSGLGHGEFEAASKPLRQFLPLPVHRLALRMETVVVRGGRGAGKSALFGILRLLKTSAELRAFFGDVNLPQARWLDAFSEIETAHPQVAVLDSFAEQSDHRRLRVFWMGHLLARLYRERPDLVVMPVGFRAAWESQPVNPEAWINAAQSELGAIDHALNETERKLDAQGETVFAAYDRLDRIGLTRPDIRGRCIGALLALWLSLSQRYRRLRAKIFIRDDLLDAGELGFADASKLRGYSAGLEWDVASLYRLVVRHFAEASPELRAWLGRVKGGPTLEERGDYGWFPGATDEDAQYAFASHLAGEVMGSGLKKGYTYRWIPNHLQDAQGRIVPRSMLNVFAFAAEDALKNPLGSKSSQLLTPANLVAGLTETSNERVQELKEEYPLVLRLKNLEGATLLLDPDEVIERLAQPVAGDPTQLTDGTAVYDELRRIGVLSVRADGRVDVPDIYRSGFGIKRKGGSKRPR
jgi:hypothetical protein